MSFLPIFLPLLATAASHPIVKTWTLHELSEAIQTSKADPSLLPYLEDTTYLMEALKQITFSMFTGNNTRLIHAVLSSPTGGPTWTFTEMKKALVDPATGRDHRVALMQAYSYVMENNSTGELDEAVEVAIPALDISIWNQSDLDEAVKSPDTKAELRPYLEKAQSELKKALDAGEKRETINIVTPVGLVVGGLDNGDSVLLPKPTKRIFKKY